MTPPLSSGQRDSSSFLPAVCVFAECRTSKVRCNYEMPCARCIKLGLECKVPPHQAWASTQGLHRGAQSWSSPA